MNELDLVSTASQGLSVTVATLSSMSYTADTYVKPKGRGQRKPSLIEPGTTFGRLTAQEEFEMRTRSHDGRRRAFQRFTCECGGEAWLLPYSVRSRNTSSCGCWHVEAVKAAKTVVTRVRDGVVQTYTRDRNHGESKTRLYRKWKSMHARCNNPNSKVWKWYGGKGIGVAPEWAEWDDFKEWAIASGYQDGLELDRVDADSDYSPDNCRWITKRENVKRARAALSPDVDAQLMSEAAERGLTPETLIAEIVNDHYSAVVESQASCDSQMPEGSVTDGQEVNRTCQ